MRTFLAALGGIICAALAGAAAPQAPPDPGLFFRAASRDEGEAREALARLAEAWRDGYATMVVDLARLMPAPRADEPALELSLPSSAADQPTAGVAAWPAVDSRGAPRARLMAFLERQTGQRLGQDLRAWRRWMWALPYAPHAQYLEYKGAVYSLVDPKLAEFFAPGARSTIRLDEVDWGGVGVNGIPPLERPRTLQADEARYLDDDHVIFGLVVNGEARAYPKRILAWHEMALDRVGGVELTIVYCTLCGTVIPYESEVGGRRFTFGTSGLLYRSNKLMFDHETKSLWNTFEGRPVIGPLVGSGVRLRMRPVVTTTWGEWRTAHPDTRVLSVDTGHQRDYRDGAAYRDYFGTDRLMFEVPERDTRLENKAEVFVMLVAGAGGERTPLAASAEYLSRHSVHQIDVAGVSIVIVTSPAGANRAYRAKGHRFTGHVAAATVEDDDGGTWRVTEEALVSVADASVRLGRLPGQRAFWFGWRAQFPETLLIR